MRHSFKLVWLVKYWAIIGLTLRGVRDGLFSHKRTNRSTVVSSRPTQQYVIIIHYTVNITKFGT